ncbi:MULTISPECIES: hypothetical protein [Lactobacillus]|uniref:Uncharacterized protein n=1 Tax=Lactobacillus johnsonii TaxID=33959 RepID=A0A9X4XAI5_LACJH|nr:MULTISPECIES: hypothetical protein [Lactobacillus]MTE03598.1 hypothetical protein [Lactobacillus johnsonii]
MSNANGERSFTLKIKRDGNEDKWLRVQSNGTASLISLIQLAIEQFGYEDLDKMLRATSIKSGLVKFSVEEVEKQKTKQATDNNVSKNTTPSLETKELNSMPKAKKTTKNYSENKPSPDDILKDKGLS